MRTSTILLFVALGLAVACKKTAVEDTTVRMRVQNGTPYVISDVYVDPGGSLSDVPGPQAISYGTLDTLAKSAYVTFPKLYSYAWVRLTMNGKVYYLKPYDYVNEKPLAKGDYTYRIGYLSADDRIVLALLVD